MGVFNYNHLYYFYITAKLKGVTVAAKELHTSQPSLSAQIKYLEGTLKRKLFFKKGRAIELTEEGRHVYTFCKRMFEVSDELSDFLRSEEADPRAHFKIGVSPELERPFIARIVSSALKQKPGEAGASVSMISQSDDQMRIMLKLHQLDLLISNAPVYDDEIKVLAHLDMPVALVAAPSLARTLRMSNTLSPAKNLERSSLKFILPAKSLKLRQEADLYLQQNAVRPHMIFESEILASVITSLCDGLGAGFAPLPYIKNELKSGVLKMFPGKTSLWNHRLIVMSGSNLREHIFTDRLIKLFKAPVKAHT